MQKSPILALVFWCMHLHRLWSALPENARSTTPGKAIGFLFIPFFNFYWYFRSYVGLVDDTTKFTGTPGPSALAMTFAILSIVKWVVVWIPYVGTLFLIADFVVWLLFVIAATRHANIAIQRQESTRTIPSMPPPLPQTAQG